MMDHQHVDADGTGQDGIGAPGRVCCKEPVVLIPHWIKPTDRETYGLMAGVEVFTVARTLESAGRHRMVKVLLGIL